MTSVTSSTDTTYSNLGLSASSNTSTTSGKALQQADFLKLMTEQLQHQDPLKPMDNSQMVAQMAQLSTVQGIGDLNKTVTALSSSMSTDQVLRGANLIGHKVLVPSASLPLGAEGSTGGLVAAKDAGVVDVTVSDANGQPIKKISLTADKAGQLDFAWDGTDASGKRMPAGSYSITAGQTDAKGNQLSLSTYVQAPVESAIIGSDGIYLDLTGLGTTPLTNVLRVS
ncbi:flagellar hook capping FlgD N-terminal domain-containing protein [Xanthomonas rydalmerensis]|uniref:Basal-body rod modification protein FlgD n=1 Tax=Xanthomonas rydalmerensis TaxID=3046274 RepID=A0ABZ0JH55_9XANT|nr:flagellar hook capping FlgD N-terminal domain-containing protein [Xanthomonas sp. DM-2023]WOS38930.1 flagellar hook capping FlgD N-terminal domain-containing protein [Xanthomonas sp. DM-2023]WOS43111.1 flagellar hook capping FlgD N-terminal domain-containing protein [Xanthomonas sp. DM-2023]WOS47292.1 flagellar hook capping FlgD N-terminal domain-containing protein [Xanthomonas sp. DM-2023]WOS51473.1 flagellar hook capping FlgD N-terminal domain-containing protein [Xanthomonas sp. DM-2023]W